MDFLKDLSIDKVRNLAEDAFNQAKPKTEVEARVYEVLSHKNWGASSSLMNEIARDTFDYDRFATISMIVWESLENQRPAAWRIVFKGLTLLEHLIKNGSERCVDDARNHGHTLRALGQFNYYEGTIDRGQGVREKSKQVIEMLSDDDRIREERQKARKLREKFGGNLGGVSNQGGMNSGGGGGGGGNYAGYGNDSWDSRGGYGDSGIGSKNSAAGGRYDEEKTSYGGRYDQDDTRSSPSQPTPTFATMPSDDTQKTKVKKTKKKKKEAAEAPAPANLPEVDLFSFDAPPAPAPATADDDFGDFAAAPSVQDNDPFAAPVTATTSNGSQFDAFGGSSVPQHTTQTFDAFGDSANIQSHTATNNSQNGMAGGAAFVINNMAGGYGMNNMGIGGVTQQAQQNVNGNTMLSANTSHQSHQQSNRPNAPQNSSNNNEDDFGDFSGPVNSSAASARGPVDPLSKLISLDGLSKNPRKEDKLNQPIIANAAAATFVQERQHIAEIVKKGTQGSNMSFAGIDGLHKSSLSSGIQMAPPLSMGSVGSNPLVMGASSGGASAIDMMDPSVMMKHNQQSQPNNQGNMMQGNMQSQGMGSMQGMMQQQQMMMNNNASMQYPSMMGNPSMQHQGMGMQNNGTGMGMQGMTPQQQQMYMMSQMHGGGNMGGYSQQQGSGNTYGQNNTQGGW
jgi:epsin